MTEAIATQSDSGQRLLTEVETSRYIGMSRVYLRRARSEGNRDGRTPAPPYVRIGRSIRYDLLDLDSWIQAHKVLS